MPYRCMSYYTRRRYSKFPTKAVTTLQRRFHYRRMYAMRRSYYNTPLRHRMAKRIPTFYWRYRRYIKV